MVHSPSVFLANKEMRIVAMTNEGQLPMMKNMLNSAAKSGWPMDLFHCYILGSQPAAASYNTPEFSSITIRKLQVILDNMRQDKEVLWIDNDIVLLQNTIEHMRSFHGHFVIQNDSWGPCTGFFLVRSTAASMRAIQKSIDWLRARPNTHYNDQHAFTRVNQSVIGLQLSLLDEDEYPNGNIYFVQKRTAKARMVHSNYLHTTAEKVARFKEHGMWDESDAAFEMVDKIQI